MSTILKTLKKLEEDKRLLEKDLNLKDLVLQEDQGPPPRKNLEIPRNNIIVVSLVLAGVIVVALIWTGRPATKKEVTPVAQIPSVQKSAAINKKGIAPTVGIPLSNIPEQRYEESVSEAPVSVPSPVREIFKPVQEPESLEINEIRDLIQTATAQQPETYPEKLVSRSISIPNLKVKGIIFFSAGSPSNHIFVSTAESKNRKVRVGDTVQSATLKQIESNRVVFSYRNETVHLRIGE